MSRRPSPRAPAPPRWPRVLAYPERFAGKKVGLILTGGNIDPRLLASVLQRELVREHRLVSLKIIGDDRPGLLATVSGVIGSLGANIVEVSHNRLALDVPAKGAEFDIMIETRDAKHTDEIIDALRRAGLSAAAAMTFQFKGRSMRVLTAIGLALALAACGAPKAANSGDLQAANSFMAANAKLPGVVTLPSGLQYKIVTSGPATGPHPRASDEVKVNYEGKLVSGQVFNSSFQRGVPADFPLDGLVPGWVEALQLMRPGDEWILYVPPSLGYGDEDKGPIPANSVLIFRIQLLGVLQHP